MVQANVPPSAMSGEGKGLNALRDEAWRIAENHGFHEGNRSRAMVLALIHSEVSEALEADREGDGIEYGEELADIIIRVLDHAGEEGIDIEGEVRRKMEMNRERDHKHGKEY